MKKAGEIAQKKRDGEQNGGGVGGAAKRISGGDEMPSSRGNVAFHFVSQSTSPQPNNTSFE